MLTGKLLTSNSSLNDFRYLFNVHFMVGSSFTFAFRLFNQQLNERFVPPVDSIINVTFSTADGPLVKQAEFIDLDDRSMLYIDISTEESEILLGGNVSFEVLMAGQAEDTRKGWIQAALSKVTIDGSCC